MNTTDVATWVECVVDPDYEIYSEFPYPIRRKSTGKPVSESVNSEGYVHCNLNARGYKKHRLVALQFVPNDSPDTKTEVDHINRDRTDYHITNLRWVSRSQNQRNKTSNHGVQYEYVEELSDEAIVLTDYGQHQFEDYYYDPEDDSFYFFTGVSYRKLHVNIQAHNGLAFIQAINTNNQRVRIYINKFKRLYELA